MLGKKNVVIIGGGGHAKVVIDAIKGSKKFNIYGILEQDQKVGAFISGIKIIGTDGMLPSLFKNRIEYAFIGVGSVGNCDIRKMIYNNLKAIGFRIPVIVHPKAVVASDVELGDGTFVAAGAVINSGTRIGRNAIINTSSSVDHDCSIGDFVHIAPGATLSGGVQVGEETHIGTGANVIQYINIGKRCLIGAGALVRHNVADGNPQYGPEVAAGPYDKE